MKYVCSICGYIYDETKEGRSFKSLPDTWTCPWCKAPKSAFAPEQKKEDLKIPESVPPLEGDMKKLSAGELAALCSNLARGCEKQYKEEEARLFLELADYFAAAAPEVPDADLTQLMKLVEKDLNEGYPVLHSTAAAEGDRGTQRICVWGEKVTRIQEMLLKRWKEEGDAFLQNTEIWVCTVCGFIYIGDAAPELCPVCKVPAWKFEKIERRA